MAQQRLLPPTADHEELSLANGAGGSVGLSCLVLRHSFSVTLQDGFFLSFAVGIKANKRNGALTLKN